MCVKVSKYIYWIKKDLFGCFRIEKNVTITKKQVGRREEEQKLKSTVLHSRAALFAWNTYLFVYINKFFLFRRHCLNRANFFCNCLKLVFLHCVWFVCSWLVIREFLACRLIGKQKKTWRKIKKNKDRERKVDVKKQWRLKV